MLTPPRLDEPELLDEHDAPRADMERSLRDLRFINRYLGGVTTYRRLLRGFGGLRSIVDLGAGTADLLESVPGNILRVALDFKIEHLLYLRAGSRSQRIVGDALHLPFRDGSADVVTSSHFFHHFTPQQNAAILRESARVARKGVAFTDTRRHYAPLLFVHLLGVLRIFGRITRSDAPGSVRRGYTIEEVKQVPIDGDVEVVKYFPFRFGIILRK